MSEFERPHTETDLPGIGRFDDTLLEKIADMRQKRGDDYSPHCKRLKTDGKPKYTNRLFLESSPYLLQHAHNPVNWFAWGDEAFELAKKLNRPIFLSIGYSTCHWCHVMEEESFENLTIAEFLNKHFISIKVDREERPDLDSLYMTAVQVISGHGGWPMSVWLTHDGKPFFGGTYFPARDGERGQPFGFLTVLKNINQMFEREPERITIASDELTKALQQHLGSTKTTDIPSIDVIQSAIANYSARFDVKHGGLLPAPKFPSNLPIKLLLREYFRSGDDTLLLMATQTLDHIAAGGIHDHVGGGFHRYSTDEKWLVPHFEKMLYDNALLCVDFLEAYQITNNENYKRIAIKTLEYVLREMTSDKGGFYSATDADSITPNGQKSEGYYFTWTYDELIQLGADENYLHYYHVTKDGNFEGRNILVADINSEITESIEKLNTKLLFERNKRPAPSRDEKILTSWNALMISALAKAGFICKRDDFLEAAINAAIFIRNNLLRDEQLFRSYNDDAAKHFAFIDDYAYFIQCALDLYETTFDEQWIELAVELDTQVNMHYEDLVYGGFFITSDKQKTLLVREKTTNDGPTPSGNSIMAMNLLRLYAMTLEDNYRTRAQKVFEAFGDLTSGLPIATPNLICALEWLHNPPKEIIIVSPENSEHKNDAFLDVLRNDFYPNKIIIQTTSESTHRLATITHDKNAIDNKITAYICEQGTCNLPTTDISEFKNMLKIQ